MNIQEPVKLLNDLIALETSAGTDIGYLRDLSTKIKFLLGNGGWASSKIRILATHLASAVSPSPVINSDSTAWSVKNTIFAAQTFILAAAANGLGTAPMEGFDERRLCYTLNIPLKRYTIPMVICAGYTATRDKSSENELDLQLQVSADKVIEKEKIRYPLKNICYADKFNVSWDPSQTR